MTRIDRLAVLAPLFPTETFDKVCFESSLFSCSVFSIVFGNIRVDVSYVRCVFAFFALLKSVERLESSLANREILMGSIKLL